MTIRYWFIRFMARLIFAGPFRWRHYNRDRVPLSGGVILAANHASFLDPPLVGAAVQRPVCFLARESLFKGWGMKTLLRSCNAYPLDRDEGSAKGLSRMIQFLREGQCVLLFPEGTRSPDGRVQPVRPGLGFIMALAKVPVVPIRVFGTYEALNRHSRWPRFRRISVKFGHALRFDKLTQASQNTDKHQKKLIYQQISKEIMAAIEALEPHADVTRFP